MLDTPHGFSFMTKDYNKKISDIESKLSHLVNFKVTEGILITTYKKGADIDKPDAIEIVKARQYILDHYNPIPTLSDIRGLKRMYSDAIPEFTNDPKNGRGLIAGALVVKSRFVKAICNLFLKFNKTKIPIKLFNDYEKAVMWIKTLKT